jgi:hypothetical protein
MKLHDIKHNINMLVFYDLHPSQTKDFTVLAPRIFRRGTHAREKNKPQMFKTCYNLLQLLLSMYRTLPFGTFRVLGSTFVNSLIGCIKYYRRKYKK